jgi:hypothetical protein
MKFCPVVPEICRGQLHGPRKERKEKKIIRNGAKTISLQFQMLFGRLKNNILHKKSFISVALFEKPLYKIIETKDCLTDIEYYK